MSVCTWLDNRHSNKLQLSSSLSVAVVAKMKVLARMTSSPTYYIFEFSNRRVLVLELCVLLSHKLSFIFQLLLNLTWWMVIFIYENIICPYNAAVKLPPNKVDEVFLWIIFICMHVHITGPARGLSLRVCPRLHWNQLRHGHQRVLTWSLSKWWHL